MLAHVRTVPGLSESKVAHILWSIDEFEDEEPTVRGDLRLVDGGWEEVTVRIEALAALVDERAWDEVTARMDEAEAEALLGAAADPIFDEETLRLPVLPPVPAPAAPSLLGRLLGALRALLHRAPLALAA